MKRLLFAMLSPLAVAACDLAANQYATLVEAREDRLFERGWLPDILPSTAYDIAVENDLDLNRSQGSFSFAPDDFERFHGYVSPVVPPITRKWSSIEAAVESHISKGYPAYQYRESDWEWIFLCMPEHGHCAYYMS